MAQPPPIKNITVSFSRPRIRLIYTFSEPVSVGGKMKVRHDETLSQLKSNNPEHRKLAQQIADRKLAQVVARAQGMPDLIPGAGDAMRFDSFRTRYLERCQAAAMTERRSWRTYHKDVETLRRWVEVMGDDYTLNRVDRKMVLAFRDKMMARRKANGNPLAPGYINGYLRHLSAAWNWALENEYVNNNPFKQVSKVPERRHLHRIKVLDGDQVQAFRSWLARRPPWHLNAFNFALWTGCRPGEVYQAKHQDIQHKRVISGGDWVTMPFLAVPFKGRFRLVPLSDRVVGIVEAQAAAAGDLENYLEGFMTLKDRDTQRARAQQGLIFFEPARMDTMRQVLVRAAKALNTPASFHVLRHTFATEYLLRVFRETARVDYENLSKILGHSDSRVTRNHYADIVDEMIVHNFDSRTDF